MNFTYGWVCWIKKTQINAFYNSEICFKKHLVDSFSCLQKWIKVLSDQVFISYNLIQYMRILRSLGQTE